MYPHSVLPNGISTPKTGGYHTKQLAFAACLHDVCMVFERK
jgi:hypothetical protein